MGRYELNHDGIVALFADPLGPVGQIVLHKTLNVEGVMKSLLLIPGSGRLYTTYVYTRIKGAPPGTPGRLGYWGIRPEHRASAPGMPPASDTGQLLASIGHELLVEDVVKGRVEAGKRYALWLEHGTAYMSPRPFMVPALEAGIRLP